MFDNARSLLFYVANLTSILERVPNTFKLECHTVCPPGLDTLEDYSYIRSIHLSLAFTYFKLDHSHHKFYMTFRYSLPYRRPSTFSSIELFDKNYVSVGKFKLLPDQDAFAFLNNFESTLKGYIENGFPAVEVAATQTELAHE